MMVSACISNAVGKPPEKLIGRPASDVSQGWLGPRIPFSRKAEENLKSGGEKLEESVMDCVDFEFRLNDPVTMLTAEELFSNGKLVPLHLAPTLPAVESPVDIRSTETVPLRRKEISEPNHCVFSPKAPTCSSRWRQMIGLRKGQSRGAAEYKKPAIAASNTKSPKQCIYGNPRSSSNESIIRMPLLRDCNSGSVSHSARISFSSSTASAADQEDLPRFSLDLDRISSTPLSLPQRVKLPKGRPPAIPCPTDASADGNVIGSAGPNPIRRSPESGVEGHSAGRASHNPMHYLPENGELPSLLGSSMDSPRLNASGKVIFHGFGRSSSSPSTLNGGPRHRPRGMERSYSANIRVTPVLNVPVCTLRSKVKSVSSFGFGMLLLPQKREKENSSAKNGSSSLNGAMAKT